MGTIRRRLSLALAACLVVATGGTSLADHDETERRLKAIGIKPPLQKKICDSIDRGVDYLIAHQKPDGRFVDDPGAWYKGGPRSLTPLCALALSHSDTARSGRVVHLALKFIFSDIGPEEPLSPLPSTHQNSTYEAAITLMLLMAERECHEKDARLIAGRLARTQCPKTGWWGYELMRNDKPNLSTTQFAGLGLWAAERLGFRPDRQVWKRHLESLCDTQSGEGSWCYYPRRRAAGLQTYATGTFMGFANLVLAKNALGDELSANAALRMRAEKALKRATRKVQRDGVKVIEGLRESGYHWYFYNLYALEKACIFGDMERLKGKPWYSLGAAALCDVQNKDGGWGWSLGDPFVGTPKELASKRTQEGKSDLIQTSFALLFLLRSSEAYHPVTPSPVHTGVIPTTPKPEEGK